MYALDAATGKIVWEFYLVPKDGRRRHSRPARRLPLDTSTWKNAPGLPDHRRRDLDVLHLDPETGLLYVPGGNPAPDLRPNAQGGESLFRFRCHPRCDDRRLQRPFQARSRDWHDWDVSSAPALIDTAGGKKLISLAPKDGHLYGFDSPPRRCSIARP